MDFKYQKYYSVLKGKDFSASLSKYNDAISEVKNILLNTKNILSTNEWNEKGIQLINDSIIPSIDSDVEKLTTNLTLLSNSISKVNDLVNILSQLDNACDLYNNCSEEDKSKYRQTINTLENDADKLISEINGVLIETNSNDSSAESIILGLTDNSDLAIKKAQFLGTLDDDSWNIDPAYANKAKELLLFDNSTGNILREGDTLNLKVGETRVLTVRVPHNAGHIKEVIRTTAGGDDQFLSGRVVKAKSDINPDPNVVDYVNYKSSGGHYPEGVDLRTNYYDWIITATEKGTVKISQTCEYHVEENSGTPKAMVSINANVS